MKGKRKIKRTTLLIIGVVLLWGVVAIWNEVLKIEKNVSTPRSTSASYPTTDMKSNQTSINPATNGNILSIK